MSITGLLMLLPGKLILPLVGHGLLIVGLVPAHRARAMNFALGQHPRMLHMPIVVLAMDDILLATDDSGPLLPVIVPASIHRITPRPWNSRLLPSRVEQ